MATRRVRNDQTGEVGTIDVGDTTGATFKPSKFLTAVSQGARVVSAGTSFPLVLAARKATALMPESMLEPALATAGAIVGSRVPVPFASTALGAAGGMAGKFLAESRKAKRMGQPVSERQIVGAGVRSALGGLIGTGAVRAGQATGRVLFPKVGARFAGTLQNKAVEFLRGAGDKIGATIDDLSNKFPDKMVSVGKAFEELVKAVEENPGLKSLIQVGERRAQTTAVSDALTAAEKGQVLGEVTLKQAQALKSVVDRIPRLASKFRRNVRGQYDPSEIELLKFKESVRGAQLDSFGEEGLSQAFKDYRTSRQAFDLVEPHLRPGTAGQSGAPSLPPDPRVTLAARMVLGRPLLKQVGQAKTAEVPSNILSFFRKGKR